MHDTDGSFFAESKCTNKAILLNKVAEKSGFALEAVTFECVVNYWEKWIETKKKEK